VGVTLNTVTLYQSDIQLAGFAESMHGIAANGMPVIG
jgi:hypothetical protein